MFLCFAPNMLKVLAIPRLDLKTLKFKLHRVLQAVIIDCCFFSSLKVSPIQQTGLKEVY